MKLLFDTHTFIWWHETPSRLSPKVLALCQDRSNILVLSVASLWEMQIKLRIGKLQFNLSLAQIIAKQQQNSPLEILPITFDHVLGLDGLPFHHKDPFDRILIAQAMAEKVAIMSHDPLFTQYPVQVIW